MQIGLVAILSDSMKSNIAHISHTSEYPILLQAKPTQHNGTIFKSIPYTSKITLLYNTVNIKLATTVTTLYLHLVARFESPGLSPSDEPSRLVPSLNSVCRAQSYPPAGPGPRYCRS